jgi:hypothetical protein
MILLLSWGNTKKLFEQKITQSHHFLRTIPIWSFETYRRIGLSASLGEFEDDCDWKTRTTERAISDRYPATSYCIS